MNLPTPDIHPSTAAILEHFSYDHLPPALAAVSRPICELANDMVYEHHLQGAELTTGLRKLLEAKDCLVRAQLEKQRRATPAP